MSELSSDLGSFANVYSPEIDVNGFVIRDLLDIYVLSDYDEEYPNKHMCGFAAIIKLSIDAQCLAAILLSKDGETLEAISNDDIH